MNTVVFRGNGKKIMIGELDGYKKPCIMIYKNPNVVIKVGQLSSEENAELFVKTLAEVAGFEKV